MNAFVKFNRGMLKMPIHWQIWLMLLITANVFAPLFFLHQVEAQVVLVTITISMTLMILLTARYGFSRIVGLGHVVWIPLLAFLLARLGDIPATDVFGVWIRALVVLNGISLVIDTVDVVRYAIGDREETVAIQ